MKIYLLIAVLLLSFSSQIFAQAYQPTYKDKWESVKKSIEQTWHLSKVDSNSSRGAGSLRLPLPFFSIRPGRNIIFGWDTYFTNAGLLLVDSLAVFAKNAVENQFAEIEQIGFVPNASERWGLNRPQVPFLSMMVREVYEKTGDKEWLKRAYQYLRKEYLFWTDTSRSSIEDHTTPIKGLQRFYHHATKQELLSFYSQVASRFGFAAAVPEEEKLKIGEAWISEAATGMDFTPRFENRCHQFIAVDLNANLYMYEINFAWMVKELAMPDEPDWARKATNRKELLTRYCWDAKRGLFMDYDFINKRFSSVPSVATFYPLWAGMATKEQAKKVVQQIGLFEHAYGPTICEAIKREHQYQWDYPAGWPPIYYLVAKALYNYGYMNDAKRIAAKYLDVATKNFSDPQPVTSALTGRNAEQRKPGYLYEKYNVTDGTIYDAEYSSRTFQGWSYGVFAWCLNFYRSLSQ